MGAGREEQTEASQARFAPSGRQGPRSLPGAALAALALFVGVSLAGCEPVRWERPDTDAAMLDEDKRACHGAAQRGYQTLTQQPLFLPYTTIVRDDNGKQREVPVVPYRQIGPPPWLPYAPGMVASRPQLRRQLFENCMQQNGYRLVPDTGADTGTDTDNAH